MSEKSDNLFKFWEELKRRKVIRVIIGYLAAAYVILELTTMVAEPLGLPESTIKFVIVLLCIGFVITAAISWIYDLTPEGVKRTLSYKTTEGRLTPGTVKRKFKGSDIIIATLLVVVVILAYPRIFKKDKFGDIRDKDGRISIAVMPFNNQTGDTLYSGMELGMQNLLITKLSNSDELKIRQTNTIYELLKSTRHQNYASITPSIASDIALKLDVNTIILGSIYKSGSSLRITANLLNSKREEIYKSFEIDSDSESNFFTITDSLTNLIKNHLEIKVLELDENQETRLHAATSSAEAYRYFSMGMNKFYSQDYPEASGLFAAALELDPDFFGAAFFQIPTYEMMGMIKEARQLTDEYYNQIDQYIYGQQIVINYWKSYFDKNPNDIIKYAKLRVEEDPMDRIMWFALGNSYFTNKQYKDAIEAFEKALEIDRNWGGGWEWIWIYTHCGTAYHETGQHTREKDIYELGLEILPNNPEIIARQAVCALSFDDTAQARAYITDFRLVMEEYNWEEESINYQIGLIYHGAKQYDKAADIFRDLIAKNPHEPWSRLQLGLILIDNEINVDEGMKHIDNAIESNPKEETLLTELYHTKGWGLFKQGKNIEALEQLQKAWELRPSYNYENFHHIQEVEQAIAKQNR